MNAWRDIPRLALLALALFGAAAYAQLNGTYTCAMGNPGNAFDYADIGDFFTALEVQGVGGPVTLDIYDDGGAFTSKPSYALGNVIPSGIAGVSLASPLVIRAALGERPQILGGIALGPLAGSGCAIFVQSVGYLTIEGLTLTGAPSCGILWQGQDQNFSNIRIAGCRIHGIADGLAIKIWMDLTSGPDALVIENNMIWDCKAVSTASRIQGRIDCVHGIECIVRHNTIVHLDAADSSWLVRFSSVLGVGPVEQFHSNICYMNSSPTVTSPAKFIGFSEWPVFLDHNVYFGQGNIVHLAAWQAPGRDQNSIETDPMLVSAAPGLEELHLEPGSPAVNFSPVNSVTIDIDRQPRPYGSARDAGADEFVPPEIALEYASAPIAPVGTVNVGNIGPAGAVRNFTVRNVGIVDLQLTFNPPVVVVPGANCAPATGVQWQPAVLIPPAGSSIFTLFIQPAGVGPLDLAVTIPNTDPLRTPFNFTVTATGLAGNQPAVAAAPAGSAITGPPGGPMACALMPGASPAGALLDLTDPEGDTVTVQSSLPVGPVIVGLVGPAIPAPGQPLQLAWTGTVDPGAAPGVYTWRVEFSDAVNGSVVGCDIAFTVGDLPPVHVITGATGGAGTVTAPYECAFTRGEGAATSIGLCMVTDPNAGQSVNLATQAALPGNPGTVGFTLVMAGPILRIAPAAMLTVAEFGQHLYEAQLSDGLNTISIYVAIFVSNPPLNITTQAQLDPGETGKGYTAALATSGAIGATTFAVTAGALPDGLVLDTNTGQITGTPTQAGDNSFTIEATDSTGAKGSKAFTLSITDPPVQTPNPPAESSGCVAGTGSAGMLWLGLALLALGLRRGRGPALH